MNFRLISHSSALCFSFSFIPLNFLSLLFFSFRSFIHFSSLISRRKIPFSHTLMREAFRIYFVHFFLLFLFCCHFCLPERSNGISTWHIYKWLGFQKKKVEKKKNVQESITTKINTKEKTKQKQIERGMVSFWCRFVCITSVIWCFIEAKMITVLLFFSSYIIYSVYWLWVLNKNAFLFFAPFFLPFIFSSYFCCCCSGANLSRKIHTFCL